MSVLSGTGLLPDSMEPMFRAIEGRQGRGSGGDLWLGLSDSTGHSIAEVSTRPRGSISFPLGSLTDLLEGYTCFPLSIAWARIMSEKWQVWNLFRSDSAHNITVCVPRQEFSLKKPLRVLLFTPQSDYPNHKDNADCIYIKCIAFV